MSEMIECDIELMCKFWFMFGFGFEDFHLWGDGESVDADVGRYYLWYDVGESHKILLGLLILHILIVELAQFAIVFAEELIIFIWEVGNNIWFLVLHLKI